MGRIRAPVSERRAGASIVMIGGLIAAAGLFTWFILSFHTPATGEAAAKPSAPPLAAPSARAATPAAAPAPPLTEPKAVSAAGDVVDTRQQDQRQDAKITRGLARNPEGGVLVQSTPPGSVASLLHVHVGDVIVSVNGGAVASPEEIAIIYREQGAPRQMTVIHNGIEMHRH
jgi:S1-C subfamily serine protease